MLQTQGKSGPSSPNEHWVETFWNRRVEHWAIRFSSRSFTRTAHSFIQYMHCALRLRALPCSPDRSLAQTALKAYCKMIQVYKLNASNSCDFYPMCIGATTGFCPNIRAEKRGNCWNDRPLKKIKEDVDGKTKRAECHWDENVWNHAWQQALCCRLLVCLVALYPRGSFTFGMFSQSVQYFAMHLFQSNWFNI